MKRFKNWIPTSVAIVAVLLAFYYMGVLDSKITVGVVVIAFSVLLFLSALLPPPHKEE